MIDTLSNEENLIENNDIQENEPILNIENENSDGENYLATYEDVRDGKVDFRSLSPEDKQRIKEEAYLQTPEDKRWLWNEGFSPPGIYGGKDKYGNPVKSMDIDEFEKFALKKKGRKENDELEGLKKELAEMKQLLQQSSVASLNAEEEKITEKMREALDIGDTENYEKFYKRREDIRFAKMQSEPRKVEPVKIEPQINHNFSLEEQTAITIFTDTHADFVDLMKVKPDIAEIFDKEALRLKQTNPDAPLEQVLNAAKKVVENRFINNNKNNIPIMNTLNTGGKGSQLASKPSSNKITYNSLSDWDKKWISGEARNYPGKTYDEIANIVFKKVITNKK